MPSATTHRIRFNELVKTLNAINSRREDSADDVVEDFQFQTFSDSIAYGEVFIRRLRSIGIRDRPTSPRSPWQNGYAERLIGSIRRECLDNVVVLSERHLRRLLLCYNEILQWGPHASIPGERCARLARSRSRRAHSLFAQSWSRLLLPLLVRRSLWSGAM
jgi:hypothetical protein